MADCIDNQILVVDRLEALMRRPELYVRAVLLVWLDLGYGLL